jgi:hypothetical protein
MLLLMSNFSPFVLGLHVGWALQLSKIPSNFIKSNVLRSFSSSASFVGRDLMISIFVSSPVDRLNLSSSLNLPSVLDYLPPFVGSFDPFPLLLGNMLKLLVKSFLAMGRWVHLLMLLKLIKYTKSLPECK